MSRTMALTRALAAGILLFGAISVAHSMPMHEVDQESVPGLEVPFGLTPPPNLIAWQQGVTAGKSGILTQIDIDYYGAGNPSSGPPFGPPEIVQFRLYSGVPGALGAILFNSVLMFGEQPNGGIVSDPGPVLIDVGHKNIVVDIGTQFVIELQQLTPSVFIPSFTGDISGNVYGGGSLWFQIAGMDSMEVDSNADLQFTTYVRSLTVPEPTVLTLLLIGLLGIPLARKRPRQRLVKISR
jgi:hypothetical protein